MSKSNPRPSQQVFCNPQFTTNPQRFVAFSEVEREGEERGVSVMAIVGQENFGKG